MITSMDEAAFISLIPKGSIRDKADDLLDKMLMESRMMVFKTSGRKNQDWWKMSMNLQKVVGEQGLLFSMFDTDNNKEIEQELFKRLGKEEMPQLWLDGKCFGSGVDLMKRLDTKEKLFDDELNMKNINDY